MQFDWTTFVLEVLNFLVLVWILKRFLYRPVLDVLDARQARVRDEMAQAEQQQRESAALRQEYETRLTQWAQERERLRQQLGEELAQKRAAGVEKIRQALVDEESKTRARGAAATAAHETELIRKAAGAAYGNAAAMLRRLASPALTAHIADVLIEDLARLPSDQLTALREAAARIAGAGTEQSAARLAAAHALDDATLQRIGRALSAAAGRTLPVETQIDATLIAGVRVSIGECLFHANLTDELDFFQRQSGGV